MLRIVLVRHGETYWNKEGKFQGRLDIELNDIGKDQARKLALALADVHIDAVYSSPLSRAYQTAEMIAERHGLEVIKTEEMSEISHGSWEGMHLEAVIDIHGKLYDTWLNSPHKAKMPGGEDLNDVRERAVRKLMEIVEMTPDGSTVLVVGHDATNKVLLCYALGLDNSHFWQIKQGNAGISILEYEDGMFRLVLLNDTYHLGGVLDMTTNGAL